MHYKPELMSIRYWGGVWVVAVLVFTFVRILGGGAVSHFGKSSAFALVFGFGMDSCQTSVISNSLTSNSNRN
jgi:hypothetical protein